VAAHAVVAWSSDSAIAWGSTGVAAGPLWNFIHTAASPSSDSGEWNQRLGAIASEELSGTVAAAATRDGRSTAAASGAEPELNRVHHDCLSIAKEFR